MIRTNHIKNLCNKLLKEYATTDPYRIAKYHGIIIMERPYKKQLGAFCIVNKVPFIFIKEDLSDELKNQVLLHELGHYFLHRQKLKDISILRDFSLLKIDSDMEKEANLFKETIIL